MPGEGFAGMELGVFSSGCDRIKWQEAQALPQAPLTTFVVAGQHGLRFHVCSSKQGQMGLSYADNASFLEIQSACTSSC